MEAVPKDSINGSEDDGVDIGINTLVDLEEMRERQIPSSHPEEVYCVDGDPTVTMPDPTAVPDDTSLRAIPAPEQCTQQTTDLHETPSRENNREDCGNLSCVLQDDKLLISPPMFAKLVQSVGFPLEEGKKKRTRHYYD